MRSNLLVEELEVQPHFVHQVLQGWTVIPSQSLIQLLSLALHLEIQPLYPFPFLHSTAMETSMHAFEEAPCLLRALDATAVHGDAP